MPAQIVVPQLGESVVEARIARWLKKPGDPVSAGEPLVELETEKIDLEVGAEHAGVLLEMKRQEGEDVKVGEVLAASTTPGERRRGSAHRRGCRLPEPAAPGAPAPPAERATPTARKVAAEQHAIDLGRVPGTGDAGRVTKRDVETFVAKARGATPPQRPARLAPPCLRQPPVPRPRRPRPASRHDPGRRQASGSRSACACRSAA